MTDYTLPEDFDKVNREWVLDSKKIPMDEVIDVTIRIILGGVRGFFK